MINILILFIIFSKISAELKLTFFDEFNNLNFVDPNKWDVQHEDQVCDGNFINQLNCKTNSTNNLRIIEDTLALTAIHQKYLNKEYTSPLITTKESFTYGRFEIRASLPKGKMIRPTIYLVPTFKSNASNPNEGWARDGQIEILVNNQNKLIEYGLHYSIETHKFIGNSKEINENLNDFHDYILEWSESDLTWTFDNSHLATYKLKDVLGNNYNPFDKPFKLRISLGVGGEDESFPGQKLRSEDAIQWKCSLLILDYVRIYQDIKQDIVEAKIPEQNKITSNDICNKVMPLIRNSIENYNKYNLIFSDEFNDSNELNSNQWDIQHEDQVCDGNNIGQLHCKRNSSDNLRIINGTLVLAAIHQKYLNNEYTSALITTKNSFTFGKFEIRAALPKGKMLRTSIDLVPIFKSNASNPNKGWSRDGQIEILVNNQNKQIYHGLHYSIKTHKFSGNFKEINENLNDFHNYIVEWSESDITWFFDKTLLETFQFIDILGNTYNPFDKPFKLRISLGVGGEEESFPGQKLRPEDAIQWNCSLLILDYIRIYQRVNESIQIIVPDQNETKSIDICNLVMKSIRRLSLYTDQKDAPSSNNHIVTIIAISSSALLLALIPLIIYIFIRMRKSNNRNDFNADIHYKNDGIDIYQDVEYNLYTHPESNENQDNVYSNPDYSQMNSDYLQMTNE